MAHPRPAAGDRVRPSVHLAARAWRNGTSPLLVLLATAALGAPPSQPAGAPPKSAPASAPDSRLDRATVPAKGREETLLNVERFGRYAVKAASSAGTGIRIIDRMAGELGADGSAGHENGRIDLFLDRGVYKLVAESDVHGDGTAKLSVEPFRDGRAVAGQASPPTPELVSTKLVEESLDDVRQLSYWLRLDRRTKVRLEAAGRNLSDLRLWRDGNWLEDVSPNCAAIEPTTGQPLLRCEITTTLPAGLFLLTAYGGPSQPWSIEAPEHPFFLRWGYPLLAETGRQHYRISPFGEDRFQLPEKVNYVHIEIPKAQPFTLTAGWLEPWDGLASLSSQPETASEEIRKNSIPPVATVHVGGKPGGSAPPEAAPDSSRKDEQAEPSIEESDDQAEPAPEPAATSAPAAAEATAEAPAEESPTAVAETPSPALPGEENAAAEPAPSSEDAGVATGTEDRPSEEQERPERAAGRERPSRVAPELWVAVKGTPDQDYVLQQFEQRDRYRIDVTGKYWVSTVHSGVASDSVDATAVLTSIPATHGAEQTFHDRLDGDAAIPLDPQHAWARRFNFLGPFTLFVEVRAKGRYELVASGGGRYRLEPFLTYPPPNQTQPPFVNSGAHWDLDPGIYLLSGEPTKKGIVTLGLRPAGAFPQLLQEAAGSQERNPVRAAVRFAPVELAKKRRYMLISNEQPGVESGLVLRRWPVDLSQPLPIAQRPDETVGLDVTVDGAGTLRAETDDGRLLDTRVDGAVAQAQTPVTKGPHHVEIAGSAGTASAKTETYTLWFEPEALAAKAPLPALPATALAALPTFPALTAGAPRALDLERGASATYLVQAEKPGLYQLQTTGVLATSAALRTRTVTQLATASANGVGRNALVNQYLREGDFEATFATIGQSQGHLGVELTATPLRTGGGLRPEVPARATLAAGEGIVYTFKVPKAGTYRLLAMGLGFVFRCRLEDADGWPIMAPNLRADERVVLQPGTYRLVLLPQAVAARAVTLLHREAEPEVLEGHGPHALRLGQSAEQVWREPAVKPGEAPSGDRPPDIWTFELPAPATVTIGLDQEMEGDLLPAGATAPLAHVPPGRSLNRELPAGSYRVAVVCSRRNSLVRYHIRLTTTELVAGEERTVQAPLKLQVSVGEAGLVEIGSLSASDVRARLYESDGKLVADEDDRPDDWNFLIAENLRPGRYRLEVEPVGRASAKLRLALNTLAESPVAASALPVSRKLDLAGRVAILPLTLPQRGDLLVLAARDPEGSPLGIGLERRDGASWQRIASASGHLPQLAVPVVNDEAARSAYRLRVWALDPGPIGAIVGADLIAAPRISEGRLGKSVNLTAMPKLPAPLPALSAAVVELGRPGVLRLTAGGEAASWLAGSVAAQPLGPLAGGESVVAVAPGATGRSANLWVIAEGGGAHLRGGRLSVAIGRGNGQTVALPGPGALVACDLARERNASSGPLLAIVTAPSGRPSVELGEADGERPAQRAADVAVGPHAAVSVALAAKQPIFWAWDADPRRREGGLAALRLTQVAYAAPAAERAGWGITNGEVQGNAARAFDLPAGTKKIRLSLGANSVAVFADGSRVISTHWTGGGPFEEQLDSEATRLVVLHVGAQSDPFSLELLSPATGEEPLALAASTPFVRTFDHAGVLRLRVGPGASSQPLHVRVTGAAATGVPMAFDDRGHIDALEPAHAGGDAPDSSLPALDTGVLLIPHGPGVVLAWRSGQLAFGAEPMATGAGWRGPLAAPVETVAPPATVPLSGRVAHLAIAVTEPSVLHLRATTAALVLLDRPLGGTAPAETAELAAGGVDLDAILPAGTSHIGLASLGDSQLSGFAELTTTGVLPAKEGLGPEILLPTGATRYFSFHVDSDREIGWAAAADAERVTCRLRTADGRPVRSAAAADPLVGMAAVAAGDYLLAITAAPDAPPLRVRPVVVGLVQPGTGPPEDVVRQYLNAAGASPAPENHP